MTFCLLYAHSTVIPSTSVGWILVVNVLIIYWLEKNVLKVIPTILFLCFYTVMFVV